jgi:putative phage-type endonuclease
MKLIEALAYKIWLEWRELGLGGSDAATIMGLSPWETPFELWARRTGRLAARRKTPAMQRGLELEADARRAYEELTGTAVPQQLAVHGVHEWLRASFDGYSRELRRPIEIKCPGKVDHALACAGKIPEKYIWQLVHLMLVADAPEIDYVSYDEKTLAIITMKRDFALEGRLIKKEIQFWNHIVTDVAPPSIAEVELPYPKETAEQKPGDKIFKVRRSR